MNPDLQSNLENRDRRPRELPAGTPDDSGFQQGVVRLLLVGGCLALANAVVDALLIQRPGVNDFGCGAVLFTGLATEVLLWVGWYILSSRRPGDVSARYRRGLLVGAALWTGGLLLVPLILCSGILVLKSR